MSALRSSVVLVPLLVTATCASEEGSGDGGPAPAPHPRLEQIGLISSPGPEPNILAPSSSGLFVLLGDRSSPVLTVLDAADGTLAGTIVIREATGTLGIAASPGGRLVYVAAADASTILVYDLQSGLPDHDPLLVGQTTNLVATADFPGAADGRFVVATAFNAGLLRVFDKDFNYELVDRTMVLDDRPAGLAVTRLSSPPRAYVVGLDRGKLLELEIEPTRVAITDSVLTEPGASFIALSPDERTAYISQDRGGSGRVLVVDLLGKVVVQRISVGGGPLGLDVSPDGRHVVVANSESGSVSLIDVDRGVAIDELTVGVGASSGPTDVLFTSASRVFVTLREEAAVAVLALVR